MQFVHELLRVRDKMGKETGRWSGPACSPLWVSISFPSFLFFSTATSNWIVCGDVLSPISSLCFTLTIVLYSLNCLYLQPLWPSTPLPYTRQASQCLVCSIFHHWWEDVLFNMPRTPVVIHSQLRGTAQYSNWRTGVNGLQLGDPKEMTTTAVLCVCVCAQYN